MGITTRTRRAITAVATTLAEDIHPAADHTVAVRIIADRMAEVLTAEAPAVTTVVADHTERVVVVAMYPAAAVDTAPAEVEATAVAEVIAKLRLVLN
jgi:hypothetical protein